MWGGGGGGRANDTFVLSDSHAMGSLVMNNRLYTVIVKASYNKVRRTCMGSKQTVVVPCFWFISITFHLLLLLYSNYTVIG